MQNMKGKSITYLNSQEKMESPDHLLASLLLSPYSSFYKIQQLQQSDHRPEYHGLQLWLWAHSERVDADAPSKVITESTEYFALTTHVQHLCFPLGHKLHERRNNIYLAHGATIGAYLLVKSQ